jgi:hypothetical protein
MNTHVVVRRLPGPSGMLEPGTEVDASAWRNVAGLEAGRFIQPLPKEGQVAPNASDLAALQTRIAELEEELKRKTRKQLS